MSNGTLHNLAIAGHIPTPQRHADRLLHLLRWETGAIVTLADLAGCGEGNLLAPFARLPGTRLYGIEVSAERAETARQRLPGAQIVRAGFEATKPTADSFSLCVSNPPYLRLDDGRRAEYAAQTLITRALQPGGVNVAIIPARSGLDGTLINHWAKHFTEVRCWRFPDGDASDEQSFQKYSQIVLAGVKRAAALPEPDPVIKAQLQGWRYDSETSTWAGGTPPPVLPCGPIPDPYLVPAATATTPEILVIHADDGARLSGLAASGVQHTPAWREATTLVADGVVARPLMPPTGPAHLASLILAGLLDGDILDTPSGRIVLTTSTSKQATPMPISDEDAENGVVELNQIEDNPVLGVLYLQTGLVEQYQGAEAFAFLQPLLPALAAQVLERHQPLYQLDPEDWELLVVAGIGLDKQLPGAAFPGLAPAQMHRVFALRRALWAQRRAMLNGEPGVGKTRQLAALIATLAYAWQERARAFSGQQQPAWARSIRRAWRANRHLPGDAPRALPVWIAAPKRVLPTWQRELAGAYPEAEVVVIRDHRDVDHWLARCAESDAPVVVGLISHSTKAATGVRWLPAVEERTRLVEGRPHTTFRCTSCGATVEAVPRGKAQLDDDTPEPVTSRTYFERQRRWCAHCGGALWTIAKTDSREARYPHTPFAAWSRAASSTRLEGPQRITPDGSAGPVCPDSFSPYAYAHRKYRGCVSLAIVDESHNGRGSNTDIARAHHQMMLASQCRVLASGTHTGGEARHLFHYVFRYNPQFWLRLGFQWGDVERVVERYGVVQERVVERESDARRGSGAVDRTVSTVEVPGMSASLLPHLLSELIVIGVLDVGAFMPKLVEIPVLIDMDDPALPARIATARAALEAAKAGRELAEASGETAALEAAEANVEAAEDALRDAQRWILERDLRGQYRAMMGTLERLAEQGITAARLAKGSVPRWWSVLPMEQPPFRVTQTFRDDWGDITGQRCILDAPVLTPDHCYPLEREVRELVTTERAQHRRVLLYVEQNEVRVTARRYREVLRDFNPWCLPKMDPEEREDVIREAVRKGATVVICPYTHVSEGLNLQNEFDTVIWVEMAQSHFLRDQASRRIWRLGKQFDPAIPEEQCEVRVYYLVYEGTAAHKKLHKLGLQSGAASLFSGDTPDGALVEQAGAHQTALAQLSRGLEEDRTGRPARPISNPPLPTATTSAMPRSSAGDLGSV
ncbi:MAG: hypothetical protein OHK0022_21910 [Roseiflexaceae bacterium]